MDVLAERASIDRAVSGKSVGTVFAQAASKWGERDALHWKDDGSWRSLTWREYRADVAAVTLALRSLGFGPGQFGLIMARNAPGKGQRQIADLGETPRPLRERPSASTTPWRPSRSSTWPTTRRRPSPSSKTRDSWISSSPSVSTPHLRHLVLVRGSAPEGCSSWDSLVAKGREMHAANPAAFESSWRAVDPEDPISLIYTSGTTGPPKGVVYSHNNVTWTLESIRRFYELESQTLVSYLPLAHVAERFTSQWGGMYNGHDVWLCPDPNLLLPYLLEGAADVLRRGPARLGRAYGGHPGGDCRGAHEGKRKMAQGALSAAISAYRLRHDGKPVPAELAAGVDQAQPFMLLRSKVGMENAPRRSRRRPHVDLRSSSLGRDRDAHIEGRGMSELTGPATAVPHDEHAAPSIGRAIPGVRSASPRTVKFSCVAAT